MEDLFPRCSFVRQTAQRNQALSILPSLFRFRLDYSDATFQYDTTFVAKNQDPTVAPDSIIIPAIPKKNGKIDREDLNLCPVRALRCYLKKVEVLGLRGTRCRLFVPF